HLMGAWAQSSGGMGKIHFLADLDAGFTKAVGLDADLSAGGLGLLSKRYSMLVEDGVVKALNVEESSELFQHRGSTRDGCLAGAF
ncbi:redoxin family protein, partial [Rhizobium leguminosarum]|uniref:redoxin family protein n=1 Tax=Rhizobium leguminosarum TaxID=384 RepID=UPI003F958201